MLPDLPSILALVLLQAPTAVESPPTVVACEDMQRVELSLVPTAAFEVCISRGMMTGFLFDAPVTVELQDEMRFEEVVRGRQLLTLVPPPDMAPGERIRLTVRFKEDTARQSATFVLVGHRGQATHHVEVYHNKRTRESYQQELEQQLAKNRQLREENQQLREENQQLRGEVEQLRVRLNQSVGLTGLYLSGALGPPGIQPGEIPYRESSMEGSISMLKGITYRADNSVAAEVWLRNSSTEAWVAVGASLVTAKGEKIEEVRLYQPEAIPPNETRKVFVEFPAGRGDDLQGQVTLNLWEAGPRTISIPKVMFPQRAAPKSDKPVPDSRD
ncbi:DUF2381 family protein [Archangium violaceum]|uniref:DUF2381 family protein n=1 Tax=Archangium violaceum TaxID=83451 RepID=UPI002B2AC8B1|nr:DUF2381 family protein [Archangium gephyra]